MKMLCEEARAAEGRVYKDTVSEQRSADKAERFRVMTYADVVEW
jgi:arginine/ornithine N-succinyltransferase beta subunit